MKLNNFKHKAVVLTAGVATLFATSCKDFLEEDLRTEYATTYIGKYEQFQSLTAPLYGGQLWAQYEQKFSWCVNEGISGVLFNVYDQEGALFQLSIGDDNTILREGYTSLYAGVIATANQVINKITRIREGLDPLPEGHSVTPEQLEEVKGEALLFRAFAHFLATEYFGEVPLVLNTEKDIAESATLKLPKATRATLYKSIEKDLLQAASVLPESPTDPKRVSKWSALAVLAKLYLTMASCQQDLPVAPYKEADVMGKYEKVKQFCDSVINRGGYQLLPHKDIFSCDASEGPCSETVFAIYFVNGEYGEGSSYQSQMGRNGAWSPGSGWGEGKGISYNLYKSFDNSDPRKKELCLYVDAGEYECRSDANYPIAIYGKDFHGKTADGCFGVDFFSSGAMVFNNIKKFVWGYDGINFHEKGMSIHRRIDFIRLSDVYMMRAEAAMAMANSGVCDPSSAGIEDINAVLKAHGAKELTAAIPFIEDLSAKKLSVESFTIILDDSTTANVDVPLTETMYHNVSRYDFMQERRKEFAMEGQAWLDLKRLYYRNPQMAEKFLVQMDRGVQMSPIPNITKKDKGLLDVEEGYARRNVINALSKVLANMYPEKWEASTSPDENPILIDNFIANNYWFLPIPVSAQTGLDNGPAKDFVSEVERGTYPY